MALSITEIQQILEVIEASGWDEAQVTIGDVTLSVSKNGHALAAAPVPPAVAAPAPAPAAAVASAPPAAPAAPAAAAPSGHVVESPTIGMFWRAPEPGAPPFVEVGQHVEAGATLCIVEVMKLMNHVTTEVAGVVTAIHPANGDPVEFGEPLFSIEPS